MRLRLIDRVRRFLRPGPGGARSRGMTRPGGPVTGSAASTGRHRRDYASPGQPGASPPGAEWPGADWAGFAGPGTTAGTQPSWRGGALPPWVPPAPPPAPPPAAGPPLPRRKPRTPPGPPPSADDMAPPVPGTRPRGRRAGQAGRSRFGSGRSIARQSGPDRAAIRPAPGEAAPGRPAAGRAAPGRGAARDAAARAQARPTSSVDTAGLAWYEVAHARRAAEGYADCGPLEQVLRREWPAAEVPSAPVVRAVNRLAQLPQVIKEVLAAGLDAIHVGDGGVPDLDDMSRLRGVPLPSGRATWDACAGAYGERKIIVGSRPSAAPDVMCHEVGHALDDIDRVNGTWQSDSAEFRRLYERCQESLVSDFHKQDGDLGRREFFADAFAAIASRQRPALVDMLGGNTRPALDVMLYFNLRYGL
jgi:hypothetical protein